MINGAATMPIAVTISNTNASMLATWSTKSLVVSAPCRFLYSDNTGTKACENAPSANNRRSKLGMRNATKNASVVMPAPKLRAMTVSRTKPRMRDNSVMLLTWASALSKFIVWNRRECGYGSGFAVPFPEDVLLIERQATSLTQSCCTAWHAGEPHPAWLAGLLP